MVAIGVVAGFRGPNRSSCTGFDGSGSASRSLVAISVVAAGTDPKKPDCAGFDGADSDSRSPVAISVLAGTDPKMSSECTGPDGESVRVTDGTSVFFCGEGLARTIVGRLSSCDDSVRGAVGELREFDGKAFLASEVLASGLLT